MRTVLVLMSILLVGYFSCQRNKVEQGIPPEVTAVFPSSDTLPENLLRMYIHFSKPMKTIGNLEKIKLLNDANQEVIGAIFNNVHELWDHQQQQLTLIFDPARVKAGLRAHQEMGRALQAGRHYTLQIGTVEDVYSHPMEQVFTKSFLVAEEDKIAPNTKNWQVHTPKADGKSPLIIQFPNMLDQLSLLQRLQLTDSNHRPIDGRVEIKDQETIWYFKPSKTWSRGDYILYVHTRLEDPAGNNLNGLFDHKIGTLKNSPEDELERIYLIVE